MRGDVALLVSTGENSKQVWIDRLHGPERFFAVEVRHGLVQQDQVNVSAALSKNFQRLPSIFGDEDVVPVTFKDSASDFQNKQLVVNDQDQTSSGQAAHFFASRLNLQSLR